MHHDRNQNLFRHANNYMAANAIHHRRITTGWWNHHPSLHFDNDGGSSATAQYGYYCIHGLNITSMMLSHDTIDGHAM